MRRDINVELITVRRLQSKANKNNIMFTFLNEFLSILKSFERHILSRNTTLIQKDQIFFLNVSKLKKWVRMFFIIAFNLESLLLVILHLI